LALVAHTAFTAMLARNWSVPPLATAETVQGAVVPPDNDYNPRVPRIRDQSGVAGYLCDPLQSPRYFSCVDHLIPRWEALASRPVVAHYVRARGPAGEQQRLLLRLASADEVLVSYAVQKEALDRAAQLQDRRVKKDRVFYPVLFLLGTGSILLLLRQERRNNTDASDPASPAG
jgi:hypothetical protein